MHWLRVVEGKDGVQPRYTPGRLHSAAFCLGLEPDPARQVDPLPPEGAEAFPQELERRTAALAEELRGCLEVEAYRPSAEQCDRMMVSLERHSRWLATACRAWDPTAPQHRAAGGGTAEAPAGWHYHLWEPYLNAAVIAWQENSLQPFQEALRDLLALAEMSPAERAGHFLGAGYPLRSRGKPRMKVAVFSPVLRPLRTRSVFQARLNQLLARVEDLAQRPVWNESALVEDVRHITRMVRENHYMLASNPGFLEQARPGLPTIRGWPSTHPFLVDPVEFFKKAILFDNGTYGVAGGGQETMYLQVRQLERYYRFHRGPEARRLTGPLSDCAVAWEENCWPQFTAGLVELASRLRRERPPSAGPTGAAIPGTAPAEGGA